jgi:hypothetical protein
MKSQASRSRFRHTSMTICMYIRHGLTCFCITVLPQLDVLPPPCWTWHGGGEAHNRFNQRFGCSPGGSPQDPSRATVHGDDRGPCTWWPIPTLQFNYEDSSSDASAKPLRVCSRAYACHSSLCPVQVAAIKWLWGLWLKGKGGILGDDMGLGKTRTCASFLAGLLAQSGSVPSMSAAGVGTCMGVPWHMQQRGAQPPPTAPFQLCHACNCPLASAGLLYIEVQGMNPV